MRPVRSLLIYLVVVFAGGALLAPWLYWLAQWAGGHGSAFSRLARNPFYRFEDRALLGLALICLWPLLRRTGLKSWRSIGFVRRGRIAVELLQGFAWGWASLAVVVALALAGGARQLTANHSSAQVWSYLFNTAWAAVVVAVLEELVFRGALFGILRKSSPWPVALALSSAAYSAVHFIQKADVPMPVQWFSGLFLLGRMTVQHPPLIPTFLTLFVAGAVLALRYQRSGALYFSIGLHAGWIFWLKSYRFLFHQTGGSSRFWGTDELIDGWLSFFVLTAVLVFMAWRGAPRSGVNDPGP